MPAFQNQALRLDEARAGPIEWLKRWAAARPRRWHDERERLAYLAEREDRLAGFRHLDLLGRNKIM